MKKNYYYIGIASILLIIAAYFYCSDSTGTLSIERHAFAVLDTADISNITIENNGQKLIFDKVGKSWLIDNKYRVKKIAINSLISSLMNFEVLTLVPKKQEAKILQNMRDHPISVTIRSLDKILKKYQITDGDSLKIGSYMMLEGQERPYAVHMAGFEGRLSIFFNVNTFIWRDRVAFSYQPGEIQYVEVLYPLQTDASFTMNASGSENLLVKSVETNEVKKISEETAQNFLMRFSYVPFDWIFSGNIHSIADSIAKVKPYCEIRVKDTENRMNVLRTYRIPDKFKKGNFNPDKLYAVLQSDSIPLLVKYVDLDPIFKTYNDFKKQ